MYWIKHGIKMGLVLSLVGGCTTTTGGYVHEEQSPGVYTKPKAPQKESTRIQQGTQKPKKQLAAYRKRQWQAFQTKMSSLEQSAKLLSTQIPNLPANHVEGGKAELARRIEQLNADIAQLKQQTASPKSAVDEHKTEVERLESEVESLKDILE